MKGIVMGKKYTIKTKKEPELGNVRAGLFHRYECSSGRGAVILILELLQLVGTTLMSLCFGILVPICSWLGEDLFGDLAGHYVFTIWFIMSLLYIAGTMIVILGRPGIASIVHGAAAVMTLVMYYIFADINAEYGQDISSGPTALYMPSLFILVISVVIFMLVAIPKWIEKREKQLSEKAPSILDEEDK